MSGFDFNVIWDNLPFLWEGLQLSLLLTVLAILGGIVLGTLLALMRLSGFLPLSLFAAGYVNLIRSIPLILDRGGRDGRHDAGVVERPPCGVRERGDGSGGGIGG